MTSTSSPKVAISLLAPDFDRWDELLALVTRSFAYMEGGIDPPSSVLQLTPGLLRDKALEETCFVASEGERLVGCVFVTARRHAFYVGKLAVEPALQGLGIGRSLMQTAEAYARRSGKAALELQTRVELQANHTVFERLGFVEVARTAHRGFHKPTSITFRKTLS